MRRRLFMQLMSGVAAGALVELPEDTASAAPPPDVDPSQLSMRVASSFMEDISSRASLTLFQGLTQPYLSHNGILNLYNPVLFRTRYAVPTLERIFQAPDGPTGWAETQSPLPAFQETQQSRGIGTNVSAAILPGGASGDRLFIGRNDALYHAALDGDGVVSGPFANFNPTGSWPAVSGVLPQGSRFLPEWVRSPSGLGSSGLRLRHISPAGAGGAVPLKADEFQTSAAGAAGPQCFPLAGCGDQYYRLVIHESNGDVVSFLLTLDPAGQTFAIADRQVLFQQIPAGCAALIEATPGRPTLVLIDSAVRMQGQRMPLNQMAAVFTIDGHYDPASGAAAVTWGQPQAVSLAQAPEMHGVETWAMNARANPLNGDIDLVLQIYRGYDGVNASDDERAAHPPGTWLYVAARGGQGWTPLEPVAHNAYFAGFCPGAPDFFIFRDGIGFEHWRHEADGELNREAIEIAADAAEVEMTACYRVGVNLSRGAVPLAGETLSVSATSACRATLNGRNVVLSPTRPLSATIGADGFLWVEVLMQEQAQFPTLVFGSARLQRRLHCDLDAQARSFYSGMSEDTLRGAVDPQSGKTIMTRPDDAGAVAKALRELSKAAPPALPDPGPAPDGLIFQADLPTAWAPLTTLALARRAVNTGGARPFRLSGGSGGARFQPLDPASAQALRQSLGARAVSPMAPVGAGGGVRPMGFLGDVGEFFSDLGDAIASGVTSAFDFVYDGIKAGVNIVIDGLKYAFEFVVDTIEAVIDAINAVLDVVGFYLGRGLRWLLKAIGFIFDWEKILELRDRYKAMIRQRIVAFAQAMPDPRAAAHDIHGRIDQIKSTMVNGVNSLRRDPRGRQTFGSSLGRLPSVVDILMRANSAPKISWLIEKVSSILRVSPFPSLDVPGLDQAMSDMQGAIFSGFGDLAGDLQTIVMSWFSDSTLFDGAILDPILAVLANRISGLFDSVSGVVEAAGAALGALRDSPTAIIDWMDKPLGKGFLNGFWRGLTDNNFSFFDAGCLLPAILTELGLLPSYYSLQPSQPGTSAVRPMRPMAAQSTNDDLKQATLAFMIAGCIASAASATATAATSRDMKGAANYPARGLTVISLACSLGFAVCGAWENDTDKQAIALTTVVGVLLTAIGVGFALADSDGRGTIRAGLLGLNAVLSFARLIVAFGTGGSAGHVSYLFLGLVSALLMFVVSTIVNTQNKPFDPVRAVGYGLLQGALAGGQAALYELALG